MTIDNYGPLIGDPTTGANISVAAFGDPVRLAIIDLDARIQDINLGLSNTIRKLNDDTVTNSASLHIDSELVLPVLANVQYKLEAFIIYLVPTANDMALGWAMSDPSITALWTPNAMVPAGTTGIDGNTDHRQFTNASTPTIGGAGATQLAAKPLGIVNGGNVDGTIAFRFAEGTAGASTSAVVKAGSWISVTQI